MKIIKRSKDTTLKEEAHGGSGARKVYASSADLVGDNLDVMTRGWLPAGNSFDWHEHKDIEEIMVVVKGRGSVFDQDGEYTYEPGDVYIFPANTQHKITNTSDDEHEMLFVRIKV
ncbi:MAG: quercetin dioxygenase-like cupin family protein [Candidatus Saccharimonadales bacterium]|jgi:quercetin dioxygenase-like cupin family protein